ncbi:MAG TPA: glycosyltransferase family 2 protein [Burkholderiales bacterium]|nr:glycosyltransferase family 2 protein [Burkholderiales bacterium]
MKPGTAKLSVCIIAYNDEDKIEEALKSVAWADEIVVADSHSSDRTAEIARRYTDSVVQIDFQGFGKLRNAALAHCSHEWIFSLDTDERCTAEAKEEIVRIINDPHAADAYLVPRRNLFMGRWIRHSSWYPNYRQPQLFRKGRMRYTEELVHEGYILDGRCAKMKSDLWQKPFRDFSQIIAKMDRYSTLGAQKLSESGTRGSMAKALFHGAWAFIRLYIFQLGFLDGRAGFMIALGNFEGTFYRYAKLAEMQERWNDRQPPLG